MQDSNSAAPVIANNNSNITATASPSSGSSPVKQQVPLISLSQLSNKKNGNEQTVQAEETVPSNNNPNTPQRVQLQPQDNGNLKSPVGNNGAAFMYSPRSPRIKMQDVKIAGFMYQLTTFSQREVYNKSNNNTKLNNSNKKNNNGNATSNDLESTQEQQQQKHKAEGDSPSVSSDVMADGKNEKKNSMVVNGSNHGSFIGPWKKRYVVLTRNTLYMFRSQADRKVCTR